jgi:hypothetical protein
MTNTDLLETMLQKRTRARTQVRQFVNEYLDEYGIAPIDDDEDPRRGCLWLLS